MLLGEPPATQADIRFSLVGFPVRVTPWFWIASLLLGWSGSRDGDPKLLMTWVVAAFSSILIHEMGHAFAFRYYGVPSHIVLYHFGGLAIPSSGWSQTGRGTSQYRQIVISAAGPLAQILTASIVILVLRLTGNGVPLGGFVGDLLKLPTQPYLQPLGLFDFVAFFLYISIYWAILNLLPIYPSDGGQISRELFLLYSRSDPVKSAWILSLVCATGMAIYGFLNNDFYLGMLFGMLAYSSYTALQPYGGAGGGFGRRW